jgi:tetratricopeptide (TPR) repeat protein
VPAASRSAGPGALPYLAPPGLAEVEAALDRARQSRGGLVLLTGEPGVGKTRLAAESLARAGDLQIVWCACTGAQAGALRPWSRALRVLAAADAGVARLARRSAQLRAVLTGSVVATTDPDAVRWQMSADLADLVTRAATRAPVLIVFDDLHDADASTLRLLADVAPSLRTAPALVLGTARDGPREWAGRADAWAALSRIGTGVPMQPFGRPTVAELLACVLAEAATPDLVDAVNERTGGNPLFVTELIRMLADPGIAGRPAVAGLVPESVRAMVVARLAALSGPARSVVTDAAVLGARFRLDILAEVAGMPVAQLRQALDEADAAGVLTATDPGFGAFRHDLVRDAVYRTTAAGQRARRHERAAGLLAELAGRGRDVAAADVAHHLLQAGPGVAAQAAGFATRAGEQAMGVVAYEDAEHWYEQACASLEVAGADEAARAGAAVALGVARVACGRRDAARADFVRAAGLARRADRADLLARAALGLGGGAGGFEVELLDREQIDLLREAIAALPEREQALRALTLARLSVAATLIDPEPRRVALAEEAVAAARAAGDGHALAGALAALCDARAGPDHCSARSGHATEIIELAGRLRDPVLELLGRRLRFVASLETGAVGLADADALAFQAAAESLRHPLYLWYVPLWQGMRALREGRFDDCRRLLDEAAAVGERAGSANARLLVPTQRWCLLAESGAVAESAALLRTFEGHAPTAPWATMALALGAEQVGRLDDARARLDAVAALLPALPRDSEWLASLGQVAEAVGLVGGHPVGTWVYEALSGYSALFAVEGIGAAMRGPVWRHLAILAAAGVDPDRAAEHFAAALEASRSIGAAGLVAAIDREMRRAGLRETAGAGLRETAGTGPEAAGAPASVSAAVATPSRSAAANLFRRDGEFWTLRFAGRQTQLRDSKGMRDLATLLAGPGRAVAALDLAAAGPRAVSSGEPAGHRESDVGEVLDAAARQSYRQRIRDLEEQVEHAGALGDPHRAAQAAAERDAVLSALAGAYGLGGRVRRMGSPAERARTAVTARIREALRRIERADPELGAHLRRSVRTGTLCSYTPERVTTWERRRCEAAPHTVRCFRTPFRCRPPDAVHL